MAVAHVSRTVLSELYSPNIPVLLQTCGFDYFIADCEHGYFDYGAIAALAAVSRQAGIRMIVRLPGISREYILKYMDMGVAGLLVPMVSHADEIRQVVEYATYEPLGRRGISTKRAHNDYWCTDLTAYMEKANQETIILAQIETKEGLQNIQAIAETKGLSGLVAGPNDLSSDMGIPMQYGHPLFQQAIGRIYRHASDVNKIAGIITSDITLLMQSRQLGMRMLTWSSELGMIMKGAEAGLKELN
ncbi:HpcH/HpaI aldolase family protein [Paenibacillus hodogayensis]|uniref:HpcH/HpaI aldolase family protein n=1 Tax=Paenibacillus hodogayensis TaxID=279208 RepID=UPI0031E6A1F7